MRRVPGNELPLQIRLTTLSSVRKTFQGRGRIDVFASAIGGAQDGATLQLFALSDGGSVRVLVRSGAVRGTTAQRALSYHGQAERYELVVTPPAPTDNTNTRLTLTVVETEQPGQDTETLPARNAEAVTISDTTVVRYTSLFVGTGGNIAVTMAGIGTVTLTNVPDGTFLKELAVSKVLESGTTASDIVGFYE